MEEEELVRGVSSLGLADAAEPGTSAVVGTRPAEWAAPEGGSPGSGEAPAASTLDYLAPRHALQPGATEEELVRGVSSLGLADAAEPGPSAVVAPRPAASSAPDGGSPGSGRSASGFHTGVKQVQWASAFGADDGGLDPFSDLSGRGADVFLGDVNQSLVVAGSNAGLVSDHGFFGGNQSLATEEVRDQDFYWGISRRHALFVGILFAEEAEAASDTRQ